MRLVFTTCTLLLLFNSCAIVNTLLGWDKCAKEGCDREKIDDCNYCAFHCDSYYPPKDFNRKVGKSIDDQVKRSQKRYENQNFK